jgi:hypothetical protein
MVVRHQKGSSYPSSAPDTMCSSLIRWMQSMEPLERGAVRAWPNPHPSPEPPPGTAGHLTGGHRRQAGTPRGSSTHVQSRPGPRLSHSTRGSRRPVQPQHPGAQSWRAAQSRMRASNTRTTHPHALCLSTLTASPHRSSPPRSTPSQSGHVTCCRAGESLCGTPDPRCMER